MDSMSMRTEEQWRVRLKDARLKKRLTHAELGAAIGKAKSTVQNWEAGNNHPNLPDFENIARVLGVTPAWIAFGEEAVAKRDGTGGAGYSRVSLEWVISLCVGFLERTRTRSNLSDEERARIILMAYDIHAITYGHDSEQSEPAIKRLLLPLAK